jgi:hypothetical protein
MGIGIGIEQISELPINKFLSSTARITNRGAGSGMNEYTNMSELSALY